MQGNSSNHISDYLSELVETTIDDLAQAKAVEVIDEMDVAPLNLGMIASYYNIHHETVAIFNESLTEKTKLRGLLEIVSAATEFESIPIRHHEEVVLRKIVSSKDRQLSQAFADVNIFCSTIACQSSCHSPTSQSQTPRPTYFFKLTSQGLHCQRILLRTRPSSWARF